jgi:hypothetical protein
MGVVAEEHTLVLEDSLGLTARRSQAPHHHPHSGPQLFGYLAQELVLRPAKPGALSHAHRQPLDQLV